MGKEKRLFLLAVMTVLMSTAGYATIYSQNVIVTKEETSKIKDTDNTFISVIDKDGNSGSIIIEKDVTIVKDKHVKDNQGKQADNGIVNISTSSKAENINNGTLTGEFNLANEIKPEDIMGKTFDVIGIQKGKFINNGKIKISGGHEFTDSTNTKQKIYGKGINITSKDANVTNKGLIESSNGAIGVSITQGYFTNEGEIKTSGKGSIGIKADVKNENTSEINNSGIINVESGATGILLANNKIKLNNENGVINVSGIELKYDKKGNITGGTSSTGISITNGTSENSGKINVTGGEKLIKYGKNNEKTVGEAVGVLINGGTFTNKSEIRVIGTAKGGASTYQAKGININNIKAESNVEATNSGRIIAERDGIGVVSKGKFTNESSGYIYAINKGVGIQTGTAKFKLEDGTEKTFNGTAENKGTIEVKSGGTGVDIKSGSFENVSGEINVSGIELKYDENGNIAGGTSSTGISITNGTAENKGTINVTGGEKLIKYGENNEKTVGEAVGVLINGGTFTNKGEIRVIGTAKGGASPYQAKGINVNNANATATNTGIIIAERDGIGVVSKGTFTNENSGTIYAQNKGVGVQVGNGGTATNKGTINALKNSIGINILANSSATNENKIITDGTGTGVQLKNGIFINSGEINTGFGNAIVSDTGDNTVYLKDGSKITGRILGAEGIDVLTLGTGSYSGLNVNKYEVLTTRGGGDIFVSNSTIALEYNKGINGYLTISKDKLNAEEDPNKEDNNIPKVPIGKNLSLSNSNLIIDIKKQDVDGKKDSLGTMIEADKVSFDNVKFGFNSSNGEKAFNVSDILNDATNGKIDNNALNYLGSNSTAIWTYSKDKDGDWIANKKTFGEASKSQVSEFAQFLDKGKLNWYTNELQFLSQGAFDKGMAQLSGGLHGYIVDIAAVNARTMVNTMRNRALTRDYLKERPLNSWIQDVVYLDNNHRLGGLMNVDYTEKGILGVSEKKILPNGRLGLVYGGSKGNAEFENGESGSSSLDGVYFGGYYNHEFNNKWSLNSNANFVYTHNEVKRNVKIGNLPKETFISTYPTYTVGMGSSLIYTVKDDLYNKANFYAGVDVEKIMVGNINENKEESTNSTGVAIKTPSYNPRTYYSIVPSAGFIVQNTGYIFDKKYRLGADLNWETEVGNIKDGKRLKLTGLDKEYKVETSKRENIFSYSLFGALNLTEDLAVNAKYTSMFSDEYDADMISAGFEYKMDTMADNFFGSFAHSLENNRPFSDRWGGTFGLIMEGDDADDYTSYFGGNASSGDVATSMQYKPKITLSINDKKSNWSYYFEAYHKTNDMFGSIKSDERESHASRYHGEARWNDTYSKGSYGMSFGYRNEASEKPEYFTSKGARETVKTGTHELRLTPSFTYNLGHGFTLGGKSAVVFMYKYEGDREGQMDLNTESQIGLTYNGFMPKWSMTMNFYREDTWYDHDNGKIDWKADAGGPKDELLTAPERDQVNQLRPSITYYFGNGANFSFDARIPLGNGLWANNLDGTKVLETYETRYGFNYYYPVTPGFAINVGGTFLNTKKKNKDHSDSAKYGNITRAYAFRPNIGFYYSF